MEVTVCRGKLFCDFSRFFFFDEENSIRCVVLVACFSALRNFIYFCSVCPLCFHINSTLHIYFGLGPSVSLYIFIFLFFSIEFGSN